LKIIETPLSSVFEFSRRVFSLSLSLSLSLFSLLFKNKKWSRLFGTALLVVSRKDGALYQTPPKGLFLSVNALKLLRRKRAESRDGKNSKKRNLNENTKKKCFYENIRFFLSDA